MSQNSFIEMIECFAQVQSGHYLFLTGVPNVTIRPVLNGNIPFLSSLSRCPRDAEMSRFQKESNYWLIIEYILCLPGTNAPVEKESFLL